MKFQRNLQLKKKTRKPNSKHKRRLRWKQTLVAGLTLSTLAQPIHAQAADKKADKKAEAAAKAEATPVSAADEEAGAAERVNVDKIKEKYWARGEESEISVVQNRTYSNAGKIEVVGFTGVSASDPFLSTYPLGVSVGYHFNEYFSLHALAWKIAAKPSDAYRTLELGGKKANTNQPYSYMGTEASASLLYGKLSVIGKAIIYYDLHFLGGLGATSTENGKYFTWHTGLGQQFFISKRTSIRVDYRLLSYREDIKEKEDTLKLGQVVGSRTNFSSTFTFGLSFLLGGN